MRAILVTAPTTWALTLEEAKLHSRITHNDEDSLIRGYLASAQASVENILGRSLTAQTWRLPLDSFPSGSSPIMLPRGPVSSITSVTYTDENGDSQTLTTYVANLDAMTALLYPPSTGWPGTVSDAHPAVSVVYVCGFASVSVIDPGIIEIVRLFCGRNYEVRETLEVGTIITEYKHVMEYLSGHSYRDYTDYSEQA